VQRGPERRTIRRLVVIAGLAGWAVSTAAALRAQAPSIDQLVARMGRYAAAFADEFSSVVSEEHYIQDSSTGRLGTNRGGNPRGQPAHRELRSDFLLVEPPGQTSWLPFRDVFEVDGEAVRDRNQRLEQLFLQSSATAVQQASAIAKESARYNLGEMTRTVNNPVLVLAFLQPDYQTHFRFEIDDADPAAGADVWIVSYRETERPTFIRGAFDRDMPAHGRVWVDAATGRVVRTELSLADNAVVARVTTSFEQSDAFAIAVPTEMREEYVIGSGVQRQQQLRGIATYGRFRRFAVKADEAVELPPAR
jgi:hypothetical protein